MSKYNILVITDDDDFCREISSGFEGRSKDARIIKVDSFSEALSNYGDTGRNILVADTGTLLSGIPEGRPVFEHRRGNAKYEVLRLKQYIRCHYSENLSMETLSGVAHLSANYLGSLFKQEEGISVSRFIEKVRVDAAAVLLLSSNRKAGDIAKACGFRNTSYFGKCFRGIYGMSPTVFRENYQSSGIKRILGENSDVDDGN